MYDIECKRVNGCDAESGAGLLCELKAVLRQTGILNAILIFGEGNQRFSDWRKVAAKLSPSARALLSCFFIGEQVSGEDLRQALGEALFSDLVTREIVAFNQSNASSNFRLILYRGVLLLLSTDAHDPRYRDHEIALIRAADFPQGKNALVLHSPSGIVAIEAAISGMNTFIRKKDIHNFSLFSLNCELNDVTITVLDEGEECSPPYFDRIFASPAYCISVPSLDLKVPKWANGGEQGDAALAESAKLICEKLDHDGRAYITGVFYSGEAATEGPFLRYFPVVDDRSPQYQLIVTTRFPMTPTAGGIIYHECLLTARLEHEGEDIKELSRRLDSHIFNKQLQNSFLFVCKIEVPRSRAKASSFIDLSDDYYGTWNL